MEKQTLNAAITGAYFGAKVKAAHSAFTNGEKIFKYLELTDHSLSDGSNWFMFDKCQLILTPLSKISDEHAVEVNKIFFGQSWQDTDRDFDISSGRNLVEEGLNEHSLSGLCWQKIIDYLRSKEYDCGHGNIASLISAGIAVDGTLLKS